MATTTTPALAAAAEEKFVLTSSRHFPEWLARAGASLAFTTYQAGKLFLIGLKAGGRLAVFERTFARCMGLGVSSDARPLMLATQYQLLRFDNVVPREGSHCEHDVVFSPHVAWITGDVDAHDVAITPDGRPVFVNTLFSCIATVSEGASFKPLWRPPFGWWLRRHLLRERAREVAGRFAIMGDAAAPVPRLSAKETLILDLLAHAD